MLDHLTVLPDFPVEDSKTNVMESRLQVGGPVPTALALLSKWGFQSDLISAWGQDPAGAMIERHLRNMGIGHPFSIVSDSAATGYSNVWISSKSGTRTTACHRTPAPAFVNRVPAEYLGQFTAIHLDGWPADAAQWAADIIRKQNGMVFLDTGSPKPGVHELIRLANHVNCPEHFITAFIETRDPVEGAQRILEMGPGSVSVTLGDKGAILVNREEVMKVKAHNIEVVDTNGAGDAFCGAMIFGIMKGIPGKQTLALANAAAALKCEKLGNTDSLPSLNKAVALANLATSVDRL